MTSYKGFNVYIADFQAMEYCSKGIRSFLINHGIDYLSFLKEGIDANTLLEKTDFNALVLAGVQEAYGKRGQ